MRLKERKNKAAT